MYINLKKGLTISLILVFAQDFGKVRNYPKAAKFLERVRSNLSR